MAVDSVSDVVRGVLSRFRDGLRGLTDDDLAVMAREWPAVHFAACVRIRNKDNEPIQPVPNIRQLRLPSVPEGCKAPRKNVPKKKLARNLVAW